MHINLLHIRRKSFNSFIVKGRITLIIPESIFIAPSVASLQVRMQVHEELLAHLHARRGSLLILEDFHQREILRKKRKKSLLSQTTTGVKNRFEYTLGS